MSCSERDAWRMTVRARKRLERAIYERPAVSAQQLCACDVRYRGLYERWVALHQQNQFKRWQRQMHGTL